MNTVKQTYHKMLKSKKWAVKRNEILKRDGRKCTVCSSTKNLNVHHTYYYSEFTHPADYPSKSLITVCEECHTKFHQTCEVDVKTKPKVHTKKKKPVKKKTKREKAISKLMKAAKIWEASIEKKYTKW